jgi:transposase
LIRAPSTVQKIALRARIIMLAAEGFSIDETAARLGVWRKTVSQWRSRWLPGLGGPVLDRLQDEPRGGLTPRITPEQICAIVALACETPSQSGLPVTHWSQQELADEAMRRGIVDQVSQRSVGRFLKKNRTSSRTASAIG